MLSFSASLNGVKSMDICDTYETLWVHRYLPSPPEAFGRLTPAVFPKFPLL